MQTSSREKDYTNGRGDLPGRADGFDLLLKKDRGSAFAARQVVLAGNGLVPAAVRDDVLLLVSELVSNAVLHTGMGPDQLLRVELRRSPGLVRLAVVDEGIGFTSHPECVDGDRPGGWGLLLVDRIADRWGVAPTATGTRVWFELRFEE
jgi:anti-sigma regulatory factor (Ser/Thr protein kinase)